MKFRPNSAMPGSNSRGPGPGAYNPNVNAVRLSSGGAKIGTGLRDGMNNSQNMPGPGQFNPSESLFHDTRGAKFGSSKRYELAGGKGEGPGPG